MREQIKKILDRHNFRYKETGYGMVMACPFHDDNSPSFSINADTGAWNCFAGQCGIRSRDFKRFLRLLGWSWDSIKALKLRKGKLTIRREEEIKYLDEAILGVYDICPGYLIDRGFKPKVLKFFDIGFDEKVQRLTIPMRDLRGKLVGFSRRRVFDSTYDNSTPYLLQGPASNTLFNAHNLSGVSLPNIILLEAPLDCIWLWQQGFRNVVSLWNANVSEKQASILSRLSDQIIFFLDNDEAGQQCTEKSFRQIPGATKFRVVTNWPAGQKDPSPNAKQPGLSKEMITKMLGSTVGWNQFMSQRRKGKMQWIYGEVRSSSETQRNKVESLDLDILPSNPAKILSLDSSPDHTTSCDTSSPDRKSFQ